MRRSLNKNWVRKFFLLAMIALSFMTLANCAKDDKKSEGGGGSPSRYHISGNQCIDRTTGQQTYPNGQQYGQQFGQQQPFYNGQQQYGQQYGQQQYQIIADTCRDMRTSQVVGAELCCQNQFQNGQFGNPNYPQQNGQFFPPNQYQYHRPVQQRCSVNSWGSYYCYWIY